MDSRYGGTAESTREDGMIVENIGTDSDGGSGSESDIGVEINDDTGFQQVKHGRTRNKRPRLHTNTSEHGKSNFDPNLPSTSTAGTPQSVRPKFVQKGQMIVTVMAVGGKAFFDLNPFKLAKILTQEVGSVEEARRMNPHAIEVKCRNTKQVQKMIQLVKLGSNDVKVVEGKFGVVKGVISGVDTELSEEDIVKGLQSKKVTRVQRIKRKENGELKATRSVCLTFQTKELPEYVTLGYEAFRVKPYVPPIMRCFKCQRIGHSQAQCKGKTRCVRCGGDHSFDNCQNRETPKCVRCNGQHSAAYGGCPELKKARQIQSFRIENQISYAEAAKTLMQKQGGDILKNQEQDKVDNKTTTKRQDSRPSAIPRPTFVAQRNKPFVDSKSKAVTKETDKKRVVMVSVQTQTDTFEQQTQTIEHHDGFQFSCDQLLAFLVFIVNNLDNPASSSKSNRILLVVEAAKRCFGKSTDPSCIHALLNDA